MFHSCRKVRSRLVVLVVALALVACRTRSAPPATPLSNRLSAAAIPQGPVPHGPITAEAMTTYFSERFPAAVEDGTIRLDFGSANVAEQVTQELAALGIDDMSELAALVPGDLETRGFDALKATDEPTTNVAGLMRDLMIMHDTRRYFTKAWNHNWSTSSPDDFPIPAAYGVDFGVMTTLSVFSGDDPCAGNPCAP